MNASPLCGACGMPLTQVSQQFNGNSAGPFCTYCTTPAGDLKPRDEVREGMIQYMMNLEKWERPEAEVAVDKQMAQLPAWKSVA